MPYNDFAKKNHFAMKSKFKQIIFRRQFQSTSSIEPLALWSGIASGCLPVTSP